MELIAACTMLDRLVDPIKLGCVVVDSLLVVTPIVGFCNCSMFCCEFVSILVLQSS